MNLSKSNKIAIMIKEGNSMTSQLTFKKILSLLHEIILFYQSFLVIWLIASLFFIPVIGTTTTLLLKF